MKIYTKTGDKGQTGLFGGKRVDKDDARIEAYGTVDELNSFIGSLRAQNLSSNTDEVLFIIQNRLFTIGSSLASDPDKQLITPDITADDIKLLEDQMDAMDSDLPALKTFILPGGSMAVSAAHICRTVTRRAERRAITLSKLSSVDPLVIQYLNRLSDYFFVLSRHIGWQSNTPEVAWKGRG